MAKETALELGQVMNWVELIFCLRLAGRPRRHELKCIGLPDDWTVHQATVTKTRLFMLVNGSVQYGQWTNLIVYNTISIIKLYKSNSASDVCQNGWGMHPGTVLILRHCSASSWTDNCVVHFSFILLQIFVKYLHVERPGNICNLVEMCDTFICSNVNSVLLK